MLYCLSYAPNLEKRCFFGFFFFLAFVLNICKPEFHPLYKKEDHGIYLVEIIQGFSKIIWVKNLEK